jgi:RHS repeat-associated protein
VSTATIEPPSSSVVELPLAAHKTSTVTENGVTRSILYDNNGGQISDDGRFVYGWDAKGMLESVTEKPVSSQVPIRRVLYYYDGNHRMVGRRAETATPTTLSAPLSTLDWQLETRAAILSADGLPAEVTLVWDPVSDNLVSVVQAGGAPSDPNAGVLKQILHGGLGYDDPIEVTSATAGSTPRRLYPTYDEAGAGTLHTVMTASGQLVARNVPTDGYGAHHLELTGAAVDAVFLEAGRDSQGVLTVDVTLRSTEEIAASSAATGIRLSTVDSKGAVVRTSTTVPRLDPLDPFAARITLTADDWTTLTDPAATSPGGLTAQALSIAVTSTLRAAGWPNDLQYLPPPDWALATAPVYGTDSLRVEVRESLPSLADWIAAITPSGTNRRSLYQVDLLALLAKPSAGGDTPITTLLTARFQAQPFADPFTGKNYVRERWYDPERGSWLSPDPLGNRDSANLYAFCAGDPTNCSDPTGTRKANATDRANRRKLFAALKAVRDRWRREQRITWDEEVVGLDCHWYDAGCGNHKKSTVRRTSGSQGDYDRVYGQLTNYIASFDAAVFHSDEDGEISFVPGEGFVSITRADQQAARVATSWASAAFAVDEIALMASPVAEVGGIDDQEAGAVRPDEREIDTEAERPGGRRFESRDPLVGELATLIDRELPGIVVEVNVPTRSGLDASLLDETEYDIVLTKNVMVQVKSGGGKGARSQMDLARARGWKPVAYIPDASPFVASELASHGYRLFRTEPELISFLRSATMR